MQTLRAPPPQAPQSGTQNVGSAHSFAHFLTNSYRTPVTHWALLQAEHDLRTVPCHTGGTLGGLSISASYASAPLGDGSDSQLLSQSRLSLSRKPERGTWDAVGQGVFVSCGVCPGGAQGTSSVVHTGISEHFFLEPAR